MESKKYQIKTVQNMIDCTNEANLDNFLEDLKGLIQTAHVFNAMTILVGGDTSKNQLDEKGFTWIDDGKHEATITVEGK
mgnify:CR=1 FL=1|tara:strand:+ start:10451 stop:10687 length:237 start_codon:yes stop_codon:yes gene_type:complete